MGTRYVVIRRGIRGPLCNKGEMGCPDVYWKGLIRFLAHKATLAQEAGIKCLKNDPRAVYGALHGNLGHCLHSAIFYIMSHIGGYIYIYMYIPHYKCASSGCRVETARNVNPSLNSQKYARLD